jgi:hypothetical protein
MSKSQKRLSRRRKSNGKKRKLDGVCDKCIKQKNDIPCDCEKTEKEINLLHLMKDSTIQDYLSPKDLINLRSTSKTNRDTIKLESANLNLNNIDSEKYLINEDFRNKINNFKEKHKITTLKLKLKLKKNSDILFKNLQNCILVSSLDLSNNKINVEGVTAIANSPYLSNLTFLNLSNNDDIGDEGATAIANSPYLSNLTFLNLSNNDIEDEGVRAIANSPNLINLTSLNLSNNVIRDEGVTAIANSPYLSNLTSLNLSNSDDIGDEEVTTIANSPNLRNLTSLNLSNNVIGDEGVKDIANSPYLTNLTFLNLKGNYNAVNVEGATAIRNNLKKLNRFLYDNTA